MYRFVARVAAFVGVASVVALITVDLAFATAGTANIDTSGTCSMTAFIPAVDGQSYYPQADIGCSRVVDSIEMQVCGAVHNSNGLWYNVNGSCYPNGSSYGNEFADFYNVSGVGVKGKWDKGVCGHEYRTNAIGGDSSDGYDFYGTPFSSGETQC
jgi:hypothetical protein